MSFLSEAFRPSPWCSYCWEQFSLSCKRRPGTKRVRATHNTWPFPFPKRYFWLFPFYKKIFLVISISQKDISVSLNPIIEKGQLPSARAGFPAQMFPPMILNDTEMYRTTVIQCYNSNLPQCTVQVHCYSATLVHCYISALLHCAAPLIIWLFVRFAHFSNCQAPKELDRTTNKQM